MKTNRNTGALLKITASMLIFGSIGLVVRGIGLPSSVIALVRGAVGTVFLLAAGFCLRKKPSLAALRKNVLVLAVSGAAIGFNWILLFESYRYTTIATATTCYYTAPVFVMLLSPLVLRERLTTLRAVCAAVSLAGMTLVTGIVPDGFGGDLRGVAFALGAAVLYAAVMIANRFLKNISAMDSTAAQLAAATVVLLPYVCLTEQSPAAVESGSLWLLITAGAVHTGLAYLLYFSAMQDLSAQSTALCSYIDPVAAILFSALLLGEPMTPLQTVGTVLILGSTLLSQLRIQKKGRTTHEHS